MSKIFSDGRTNMAVRKYIREAAGKNGAVILLLTLFQAFFGICGVLIALLLRSLINSATEGQSRAFFYAAAGFAAVMVGRLALRFVYNYLNEYARASLENRCKQRLFSALLKKDFSSVTATHSAKWMNYLSSDCQTVADHMTEILPGLTGMLVQLAGAGLALLILEPLLAFLLIPAGLLLLLFSTLFRKHMKQLHKKIQEADGDLRVSLQESLSGMTMVRAYAEESWAEQTAAEFMDRHKKARMRRCSFSSLCYLGFGILMQGGYWIAAVFCGYGILKGNMTVGALVAVIQLIGQVQGPMGNLSSFIPRYYAMLASIERLLEAEQLPDEPDERILTADQALQFYDQEYESLSLSHVYFSYPGDSEEVLKDFSLSVGRGETIAFRGHSGCGKSTVFRLLLGLYFPQAGTCRICDTEGMPHSPKRLRRLFAYVPQGKFFMTGSIREIVSFADSAADYQDAEIWQALETACAGEFVKSLPQQLDTVLGEQGTGLSEGQLQRLSVARALLSGRPILLLDEATSALDEETEEKLLKNLMALKNRTILLVTHRPAALSICDRVVNFEKGEA